MALITQFTHIHKDLNRVHEGVECGYTLFESDGGVTSNSIRMDRAAGKFRER
jgi:hypothetical protein